LPRFRFWLLNKAISSSWVIGLIEEKDQVHGKQKQPAD
jgi:hypothetical protein